MYPKNPTEMVNLKLFVEFNYAELFNLQGQALNTPLDTLSIKCLRI